MNRQSFRSKVFIAGLLTASLVLGGCTAAKDSGLSAAAGNAAATANAQAVLASEITVFRSPTCGCCGKWIEHAEAAGFQVKDNVTEDMSAVKQQYGVPQNLMSCHTTVVGDYVVEGHVPVEDIQQLLTEKPDIAGIAVPRMPVGSPGMESGDYTEPYTVFSFTESGETAAFAEHS